jgi:segregation and condensation protein B
MSLKAKLEAVIYAAEEPVTLAQLAALFTAEALQWKAEQEAASAENVLDSEDQSLGAEDFSLLVEGLDPSGLDQEHVEPLNPEPVPDAIAEAETNATDKNDSAGQDSAAVAPEAEGEERRIARARDREVRVIIRGLLDELIASYAADVRGVEIREIAGGFRMATKPECHDAVRAFVKSLKPALKLSLPALETLAVIAYKQPVTAPEVNEIRGVDSSGVFGSLLSRKLIATAGRKQVIGRPILYKTTREFLLRFGLKDVAELPSMEEFEKMAAIELDEPADDELAGQDLNAEIGAEDSAGFLDPEFNSSGNLVATESTAAHSETAATAGSTEPPHTEDAAPAAPPITEQAETENHPHGKEEVSKV